MELIQQTKPNTIRALLGLSRILISVFVVIQAGLASVIALKGLPSLEVMIIGFFACLFGSSALIGFNDLMDLEIDKKKVRFEEENNKDKAKDTLDLGSLFIHHPVARGLLDIKIAVAWVIVLSAVSMGATFLIKPWLAPILLVVAVFVSIYSLLSSKSVFKFLAVASAVVVGAVAGWLAVAPPDTTLFPLFILWTFLWELGGRNLPNDFGDMNEDFQIGIKTIPVVYGGEFASKAIIVLLTATTIVSVFMALQLSSNVIVPIGFVVLAGYFLLAPAVKLIKNPVPEEALNLFNKANIYTVVILLFLLLSIYGLKII